jgi:MoxR-like ATPase
MTIKQKITELLNRLNDGVFEKEDVIALTLLSAVAGESIFLLGAPGVAKSLIARRLKYAFKDGSSFEYLMNRFSTPDEIFGPVSIKQLRDEDKYQRVVENYLPTATVVFLDEIWKAGPSIQNALLTILNEKIYRNGDVIIDPVPMKGLISASNELPSKGEGLEALWDRFLVRIVVDGVQDKQNFNDMISKSLNSYTDTVTEPLKISDNEYKKWSKDIDNIEIPENVFNVIHVIRNYIDQHNKRDENKKDKQIYISDRRWRKATRLLRTSAFLNDRLSVDLMDCFLIKDCLWNETEQIQTVSQFVNDAIQKHGYSLDFNLAGIKEELKEFQTEITEWTTHVKDTRAEDFVITSGYIEILNPPSVHDRFLGEAIVKQLTNAEQQHLLHYAQHGSYIQHQRFNVKKGKDKYHISINGNDYKLKTEIKGDKRVKTSKPHKKVEEDWDKKVSIFLELTNSYKDKLEDYRNKDLIHLRVNLFVNAVLANIVESHITEAKKEIEKIEVEIRRMQNDYKKLKDEETIIE